MGTLKSGGTDVLRTSDVARRAGYSVQQIRDLERDGALPPAVRTAAGYRCYAEVHVRAALAYRSLAAGTGPVEAKRMLRAAHQDQERDRDRDQDRDRDREQGAAGSVLALLDAAHARLDRERRGLALAREAAAAISAEPLGDVRESDAFSVSALAAALGVRPSTLRHWDAEGLAVPDRVPPRGTRRYTPDQARDARIVQQLRSAGYGVGALRSLMPQLRGGRRSEEVASALAARDARITARSRALLEGSAALAALLGRGP
ncbi:MerR family transcriptional regulator [Streptomyces sp. NPDC093085]|uniref:MerR family transcriptional regulator n=1 Tax=Streptomyces sp. NPDC093085 TaxID=3155068 RepID=UPI003445DAC5